ncbi:aminotransferase [Aureimonas sp. SA4125]|uniref:DegT/DnrJ/EryC1/StrS family aminotransferase n=1 Tax=Aureimonas sp. SA4125 TaxID=2826993 RepID=UPI001CC39640|nr:DegT/DnrJ/EryC1/StrS aminotransferase family protein [Aureimonas sp. SA4125]BDA82970.1 aminotransferase [Aureimonas sp. SA4125]
MKRWPIYDEEQISDVVDILRSSQVNAWTGDYVARFEDAYARHLGRRHAVALANGSVALDLALKVLGIGAGDEVIVTSRSFIASAACVPFAGAKPVFADVDPVSGNLSAETIAARITPRTKAVIIVHLGGWPCDMEAIMALAEKADLKVIEDCAQAHGARYGGRPVGSFGHIAAFSFCQDKIITTGGEGGLVAMDDEALWSTAWSLKDHGKSYDLSHRKDFPPGFRWLHESFGTNWRMMSIQAALGLRQLEHLEEWRAQRQRNADIWTAALKDLPAIAIPRLTREHTHAWYRFYCHVRPEELTAGWTRDDLMLAVTAAGVPCFSGTCSEIYIEHAFSGSGLAPAERLPVAKQLGETSLAFLVDPSWSAEETEAAAVTASTIITNASRMGETRHRDLENSDYPLLLPMDAGTSGKVPMGFAPVTSAEDDGRDSSWTRRQGAPAAVSGRVGPDADLAAPS